MVRRLTASVLVSLAVLLVVAGAAVGQAEDGQQFTPAERQLAEKYRPVVLMKQQEEACDSNGEAWDPAPVDIVLDNPEIDLLGPDGAVVKTAPTARDLFNAGPDFNLSFPGNSLKPGCRYEEDGRRFKGDEPDVVYAHIVSEEGVEDRIVLQYWFYWYFNDYNNTHESDWEMMQIVFPASTAEQALGVQPIEVGAAQHENGESAGWDDDKLQREGDRPVVYPASGSHATQYGSALHLGRSSSEGFGCDDSRGPHRRSDPEPRLLPSEVSDPAAPDAWLAWEGRWGTITHGSFSGPTGPITKKQWTEPITWQNDLRDSSRTVPAGGTLGPNVTEIFCNGVAAGSTILIDLTESPVLGLLVVAVLVGLVVALIRRTTWSPPAALPVRGVRGGGQIVRASLRLYLHHPLLFVGTGVIFVPLSLLTALAPFGVASAGLAAIIVNALVAVAMRDIDAGRPPRLGECVAVAARSVRCFVPPVIGAVAIIALLTLTVVGIPVAVWLLVRWFFITQAAVVDGRCGWDASRRSVDVVRGRWLPTAAIAAAINVVALVVGPGLGLVLLLLTDMPLVLINLIGSAIYALFVPYAAIATTYLYLSNAARLGRSRGA